MQQWYLNLQQSKQDQLVDPSVHLQVFNVSRDELSSRERDRPALMGFGLPPPVPPSLDIQRELIKILKYMNHDQEMILESQRMCYQLLSSHPTQSFVIIILTNLTNLIIDGCKPQEGYSPIYKHIQFLRSWIESEQRLEIIKVSLFLLTSIFSRVPAAFFEQLSSTVIYSTHHNDEAEQKEKSQTVSSVIEMISTLLTDHHSHSSSTRLSTVRLLFQLIQSVRTVQILMISDSLDVSTEAKVKCKGGMISHPAECWREIRRLLLSLLVLHFEDTKLVSLICSIFLYLQQQQSLIFSSGSQSTTYTTTQDFCKSWPTLPLTIVTKSLFSILSNQSKDAQRVRPKKTQLISLAYSASFNHLLLAVTEMIISNLLSFEPLAEQISFAINFLQFVVQNLFPLIIEKATLLFSQLQTQTVFSSEQCIYMQIFHRQICLAFTALKMVASTSPALILHLIERICLHIKQLNNTYLIPLHHHLSVSQLCINSAGATERKTDQGKITRIIRSEVRCLLQVLSFVHSESHGNSEFQRVYDLIRIVLSESISSVDSWWRYIAVRETICSGCFSQSLSLLPALKITTQIPHFQTWFCALELLCQAENLIQGEGFALSSSCQKMRDSDEHPETEEKDRLFGARLQAAASKWQLCLNLLNGCRSSRFQFQFQTLLIELKIKLVHSLIELVSCLSLSPPSVVMSQLSRNSHVVRQLIQKRDGLTLVADQFDQLQHLFLDIDDQSLRVLSLQRRIIRNICQLLSTIIPSHIPHVELSDNLSCGDESTAVLARSCKDFAIERISSLVVREFMSASTSERESWNRTGYSHQTASVLHSLSQIFSVANPIPPYFLQPAPNYTIGVRIHLHLQERSFSLLMGGGKISYLSQPSPTTIHRACCRWR